MNPLVEAYTSSIAQDEELVPFDIIGSIAHAGMLAKQGIIEQREADAIIGGLQAILDDVAQGKFALREELEDVHFNIEAELEKRIGAAAGRLHTARSRNDQVVTDFRLLVRGTTAAVLSGLFQLEEVLLDIAEEQLGLVMPGYTHLQLAQPVLLSHHLMAYWQMFDRDALRFSAVLESIGECPLGSGALAGVPYPIDREFVAEALGFTGVTANSMDAVCDRDFVIEFHSAAAICMMHVSRFCEDLILWSTREFGFITLDDAFATGSSIMPQKKNPDIAELARGRTGSVYGNLMAALTMMKGLPMTYDRDLQEDKTPLLRSADTLLETLVIFTAMLPTITWNADRMREAASAGYSLATDIADYLVRKKLPFRQAHEVVGRLVRYAESQGKDFPDLTLDEYRQFSPLFDDAVLAINLDSAIDARDVRGGTARNRVSEQIQQARAWMAMDEDDDGGSLLTMAPPVDLTGLDDDPPQPPHGGRHGPRR